MSENKELRRDDVENAAKKSYGVKIDAVLASCIDKGESPSGMQGETSVVMMRRTLLDVWRKLQYVNVHNVEDVKRILRSVRIDINNAVSLPLRECDVGSPQEQEERYKRAVGNSENTGSAFKWMNRRYESCCEGNCAHLRLGAEPCCGCPYADSMGEIIPTKSGDDDSRPCIATPQDVWEGKANMCNECDNTTCDYRGEDKLRKCDGFVGQSIRDGE